MLQLHTLMTCLLQYSQNTSYTPVWLEHIFIPIVIGWLLLFGLFLWAVGVAFWEGIAQLKRLHQIPCDRCSYFTGNTYLKCTVHPCRALTEEAIDCLDFESARGQLTTTYASADKSRKVMLR